MGLTISSIFSRLFGKQQMRILMGEFPESTHSIMHCTMYMMYVVYAPVLYVLAMHCCCNLLVASQHPLAVAVWA
jgi:hypothetical protein